MFIIEEYILDLDFCYLYSFQYLVLSNFSKTFSTSSLSASWGLLGTFNTIVGVAPTYWIGLSPKLLHLINSPIVMVQPFYVLLHGILVFGDSPKGRHTPKEFLG